jgi:phage recombination protein Bet
MPDDIHTPQTTGSEVVPISLPRLPWHPEFKQRFDIDAVGWRALIDAVWPAAKTSDAVVLALSYCKARRLDPFKRPVHIVPVWSRGLNREIESVWPGIGELRTTAFRTGLYAGRDKPEYGPDKTLDLAGAAMTFPEWCQITVYRLSRGGERMGYPGPQVYWLETYATARRDTAMPNEQWRRRPRGMLEKCAEAAALRAAFPEEIGNDYTDDEMQGQIIEHAPAAAPPRPELHQFTDKPVPAKRSRARSQESVVRSQEAETPASGFEPSGVTTEEHRATESLDPAKLDPGRESAGSEQGAKRYFFGDQYGEVFTFDDVNEAVTAYAQLLDAAKNDEHALEATWENGAPLLAALREGGHTEAADALNSEYGNLLDEITAAESATTTTAADAVEETKPVHPAGDLLSQDYDVMVPSPEGMTASQWFKEARAKLMEMVAAGRPPADFTRFREAPSNKLQLDRLQKEMPNWFKLLDGLTKGTPAR